MSTTYQHVRSDICEMIDRYLISLDKEGHGDDCVLRCFLLDDGCDHFCNMCMDDDEETEG